MATFVCLHGAGGRASYWDLVGARLRRHGHDVVAVDLPCEEEVGLDAYTDVVVADIGDRRDDVVLVAQSLAGFVAPLVCTRTPVELMVLLAAMVPRPGESGEAWWANTGHAQAVAAQHLPDDSPETLFVHDVPADVLAATEPPRDQTSTLLAEPWPLAAWPDVSTRFVLARDDRFFPAEWLRGVVHDRLGIEPIEIPGGHCAFLSQPDAVASAILQCWMEHAATRERPAPLPFAWAPLTPCPLCAAAW
jgi:pimeloyl-ACP methyl ester carboxylesterase